MKTPVIHIAGLPVLVGTRQRQRCGWCGATLMDDDLALIAVPEGMDATMPTWATGALVEVLDGYQGLVDHEDGAQLPADAVTQLDPAVTA